MRAQGRLVLLAGLAVCLSATARAQGPAAPFINPAMLMRNSSVREELKLTEEQRTKLKEELDKLFEKYKDDREKFQKMSAQERQDFFKQRNEEAMKTIAGVLEARQVKRLKEIQLQVLGPDAFHEDHVATALKLSDEQKKKMKEIQDQLRGRQREIFMGEGERQEKMAKVVTARKEALQKALEVLKEEQRKRWKSMAGESFDIKPEQGR